MRLQFGIALLMARTLNAQDIGLQQESALGQQMAKDYRLRHASLDSAMVRDYIEQMGRRLVAAMPNEPPFAYQFEPTADFSGTFLEPVSIPGGYVLTPAGLILEARDEAEFAGTMAHSSSHLGVAQCKVPDRPAGEHSAGLHWRTRRRRQERDPDYVASAARHLRIGSRQYRGATNRERGLRSRRPSALHRAGPTRSRSPPYARWLSGSRCARSGDSTSDPGAASTELRCLPRFCPHSARNKAACLTPSKTAHVAALSRRHGRLQRARGTRRLTNR
jgi:hypothetical protein